VVEVRQGGQGRKVDKEDGNCPRSIRLQILPKSLNRPFFVGLIFLVLSQPKRKKPTPVRWDP
jgi:hypothetical protein